MNILKTREPSLFRLMRESDQRPELRWEVTPAYVIVSAPDWFLTVLRRYLDSLCAIASEVLKRPVDFSFVTMPERKVPDLPKSPPSPEDLALFSRLLGELRNSPMARACAMLNSCKLLAV